MRQSPKKTPTRKSSPQSNVAGAGAAQPSLRANSKVATQPTLRSRALRILGRRELSRQELAGKLRAYADPEKPDELDALLNDLAERGWLCDARYAKALVRKRTGNFARRSIAQELKRAGVDEETTAAALAQNPESDPDDEFAAALALCQRKFRRPAADQKEKARQVRFLQSRGYSIGLALRVIKQGAGEDDVDE